jgi:hypothetical protein
VKPAFDPPPLSALNSTVAYRWVVKNGPALLGTPPDTMSTRMLDVSDVSGPSTMDRKSCPASVSMAWMLTLITNPGGATRRHVHHWVTGYPVPEYDAKGVKVPLPTLTASSVDAVDTASVATLPAVYDSARLSVALHPTGSHADHPPPLYRPGTQLLHDPDPALELYVLGLQSVHPSSAPTSLNFPALHWGHATDSWVCPVRVDTPYRPAVQDPGHPSVDTTAPATLPYWPEGHGVFTPDTQYDPASHCVCDVCVAADKPPVE